MKWTKYKY